MNPQGGVINNRRSPEDEPIFSKSEVLELMRRFSWEGMDGKSSEEILAAYLAEKGRT